MIRSMGLDAAGAGGGRPAASPRGRCSRIAAPREAVARQRPRIVRAANQIAGPPPVVVRQPLEDEETEPTCPPSDAGTLRVAVLDYGCKRSILRRLAGVGAHVTVFPHTVDAEELLGYDAVLLSNGPGDPAPLTYEVQVVRELLGRVPVLGICLGHQLLGLATGHETYKLPFGHRGANHPVLERSSGRVLVTSQNHGFAVAPSESAEADIRLALRRARSRASTSPSSRARSAPVPPRGRPGAARRLAGPRALGRRRWQACRVRAALGRSA